MLESFLELLAGEKSECAIRTADISCQINDRQHDTTADPTWETE